MSATTRRRQSAPTFEILTRTTHFRLIDGRWYRDCVARRSDGQVRLVALPTEAAA